MATFALHSLKVSKNRAVQSPWDFFPGRERSTITLINVNWETLSSNTLCSWKWSFAKGCVDVMLQVCKVLFIPTLVQANVFRKEMHGAVCCRLSLIQFNSVGLFYWFDLLVSPSSEVNIDLNKSVTIFQYPEDEDIRAKVYKNCITNPNQRMTFHL